MGRTVRHFLRQLGGALQVWINFSLPRENHLVMDGSWGIWATPLTQAHAYFPHAREVSACALVFPPCLQQTPDLPFQKMSIPIFILRCHIQIAQGVRQEMRNLKLGASSRLFQAIISSWLSAGF